MKSYKLLFLAGVLTVPHLAFADYHCFCAFDYGTNEPTTGAIHAEYWGNNLGGAPQLQNPPYVFPPGTGNPVTYPWYDSSNDCNQRCRDAAYVWVTQPAAVFCQTPTTYVGSGKSAYPVRGSFEYLHVYSHAGGDGWATDTYSPAHGDPFLRIQNHPPIDLGATGYTAMGCTTPPQPEVAPANVSGTLTCTTPGACVVTYKGYYNGVTATPPVSLPSGTTYVCNNKTMGAGGPSAGVDPSPLHYKGCYNSAGTLISTEGQPIIIVAPIVLVAPVPTTGAASSVTATTATLNGSYSPTTGIFTLNNGKDGFNYTTDALYVAHGGFQSNGNDMHNTNLAHSPESLNLTGLTCGTKYDFQYYTITQYSTPGMEFGSVQSFTTAACPAPATLAADGITRTQATLHGSFSGDPIVLNTVGFQYSLSATDLTSVTPVDVCAPQSNARYCPTWNKVITVECGKTYHFRARTTAAVSGTVQTAATLSFSTPFCLVPVTTTIAPATNVIAAPAIKKP